MRSARAGPGFLGLIVLLPGDAIGRAHVDGNLHIMFGVMVEIDDFDEARFWVSFEYAGAELKAGITVRTLAWIYHRHPLHRTSSGDLAEMGQPTSCFCSRSEPLHLLFFHSRYSPWVNAGPNSPLPRGCPPLLHCRHLVWAHNWHSWQSGHLTRFSGWDDTSYRLRRRPPLA
jgi:hypothetical protein